MADAISSHLTHTQRECGKLRHAKTFKTLPIRTLSYPAVYIIMIRTGAHYEFFFVACTGHCMNCCMMCCTGQ